MKTVFLDFDGVLFDTLKEAYILCRYAYSRTDYFSKIDELEYERFYRYKFLVYNSWQYYYLMELSGQDLTDKEFISKYNNRILNRDKLSEHVFDEKYYGARKDLMKNYNEFWNKLEKPFPFFEDIKKGVSNKIITPIIVSKKDKTAIEYRLKQYGLFIPTENIYGKYKLECYKTKAEFISEFMVNNNIKTSYFIDDNSNNLEPCKEYSNIKPLLAGWGNIKIDEIGLTRQSIVNKLGI